MLHQSSLICWISAGMQKEKKLNFYAFALLCSVMFVVLFSSAIFAASSRGAAPYLNEGTRRVQRIWAYGVMEAHGRGEDFGREEVLSEAAGCWEGAVDDVGVMRWLCFFPLISENKGEDVLAVIFASASLEIVFDKILISREQTEAFLAAWISWREEGSATGHVFVHRPDLAHRQEISFTLPLVEFFLKALAAGALYDSTKSIIKKGIESECIVMCEPSEKELEAREKRMKQHRAIDELDGKLDGMHKGRLIGFTEEWEKRDILFPHIK